MSREITAFALLSLFCVGADSPSTAPTIVSVFPAQHAVAAERDADVIVRFSSPIDPRSFGPETVEVFGRWSTVTAGTWSVENGNRTARFIPDRPFAAGETVTVSLSRGVAGADGTPLDAGYAWRFWVRSGPGSLDVARVETISVRRPGEGHVQTYGAYAGDLNGDGYSDLAVPNERANDVRVFLNDGHGGYEDFAVLPIPRGAVPSPNEGADFDRDGIVDFAVGNAGNDLVSVFMGEGDGGFRHGGNYGAGRAVRGVCFLDADGDGFTDIATANMRGRPGNGTVSLMRNDGSGGFDDAATLVTNARAGKTCASADANGDGITDLFVGAYGSLEVVVFLGNGQGGLDYHGKFASGGRTWMIVAGDVNGDGHVDVLAANRNEHNMSVLLGDGRGNLADAVTYDVGGDPLAVDIGDVDGDGDLDAVTSNLSGKNFTLYENLGDGTFGNPRTLDADGAGSCAIMHDRDNDGDLDITGVDEIDDLIYLFENPGV